MLEKQPELETTPLEPLECIFAPIPDDYQPSKNFLAINSDGDVFTVMDNTVKAMLKNNNDLHWDIHNHGKYCSIILIDVANGRLIENLNPD
jgi:hypothetical protein